MRLGIVSSSSPPPPTPCIVGFVLYHVIRSYGDGVPGSLQRPQRGLVQVVRAGRGGSGTRRGGDRAGVDDRDEIGRGAARRKKEKERTIFFINDIGR
jgi:hypothetical protein